MKTLNQTMTIKVIIEQWPETLEFFVANGFESFKDAAILDRVGAFLKLESALKSKGYAVQSYIQQLNDKITEQRQTVDAALNAPQNDVFDIDVAGLLPCPVRVPLLEAFAVFTQGYEQRSGFKTRSRLEAASVGADWMAKNISQLSSAEQLPDLFISAGFDTFFDPAGIGKYQQQGAFEALDSHGSNRDFSQLQLNDPQRAYSIISVVPAVFMVDLRALGELPLPRSWHDILDPVYARKIALPVGDFDLFNAILLNILKEFGDEGVRCLGRSMMRSLHPAQMVKAVGQVQEQSPVITILPYFFTRMAKAIPDVKIVWPEDGAIISPIFMLAKKQSLGKTRQIAEFLAGAEVGEILAQKGLFPSLHPEVENVLPESAPWKWLGWDYIHSHNIAEQIRCAETLFNDAHATALEGE